MRKLRNKAKRQNERKRKGENTIKKRFPFRKSLYLFFAFILLAKYFSKKNFHVVP